MVDSRSSTGTTLWTSACMLSCFSHVWRFATLWTVACQASLSMGFSKQEYWSGLPPPGDLPDPGIERMSKSPALARRNALVSLKEEEALEHPLVGIWRYIEKAESVSQEKHTHCSTELPAHWSWTSQPPEL